MTKTSTAHTVTPRQQELLDALASGVSIVVGSVLRDGGFDRYHRDPDGVYRAGHGCTPQAKALIRAGILQVNEDRSVTIVAPPAPAAVEPELGFQKEIADLEAWANTSEEAREIRTQFEQASPDDRANYVSYIHAVALDMNDALSLVRDETPNTFTINGVTLDRLPAGPVRRGRGSRLCWAVRTDRSLARVEVYRESDRFGTTYTLCYLPSWGCGPRGSVVLDNAGEAHEMTKTLGGEFSTETGPRGD